MFSFRAGGLVELTSTTTVGPRLPFYSALNLNFLTSCRNSYQVHTQRGSATSICCGSQSIEITESVSIAPRVLRSTASRTLGIDSMSAVRRAMSSKASCDWKAMRLGRVEFHHSAWPLACVAPRRDRLRSRIRQRDLQIVVPVFAFPPVHRKPQALWIERGRHLEPKFLRNLKSRIQVDVKRNVRLV